MFYLMSVSFLKIKSYTLKHRKKKNLEEQGHETHTHSPEH